MLLGAGAGLALSGCARRARGQAGEGLNTLARSSGRAFGTAVQSNLLADDSAYAAQVATEAGLLVPEWEAKWNVLQPEEGRFDLGPLSRVTAFAAANGKGMRGHALLWHDAMPAWLAPALTEGRGRAVLTAHLDTVLPATRAVIRDWDVLNEVIANPPGTPWSDAHAAVGDLRDTPFLRALGPGYLDLALRLARERDPTLRLTINEYAIENDHPWAEEKRQRLLRLCRRLVDARAPLDAVGIQGHLILDEPFTPEPFARFLRQLRELGLAVLITELDVREGSVLPGDVPARDAAVAALVHRFVTTAVEAGARTVLTWGLSDRDSWLVRTPEVGRTDGQTHRGLPLDAEGRRKPMWDALARALAGRGWP